MKTPLLILSGLAISGLLPAPFSATRGGEKTAERLSDAAAGSGDGSHMEARDLFAAGSKASAAGKGRFYFRIIMIRSGFVT